MWLGTKADGIPLALSPGLGVLVWGPLTNTSPVMLQVPTGMSPRKSSYSSPEAATNHPTLGSSRWMGAPLLAGQGL